jgi:hypothetical protein
MPWRPQAEPGSFSSAFSRSRPPAARSYDVSRDGERFLLLKLPSERSRPRINVVLNWFDELRAKVPR